VLAGPDGGLDDERVVGVGDEADDHVVLRDGLEELLRILDIERGGVRTLLAVVQRCHELLCRLDAAARCGEDRRA
jgi:hypothetical protein